MLRHLHEIYRKPDGLIWTTLTNVAMLVVVICYLMTIQLHIETAASCTMCKWKNNFNVYTIQDILLNVAMHLDEFKQNRKVINLFDRCIVSEKRNMTNRKWHDNIASVFIPSIHAMRYKGVSIYTRVKYYKTLPVFWLVKGIRYIYRT